MTGLCAPVPKAIASWVSGSYPGTSMPGEPIGIPGTDRPSTPEGLVAMRRLTASAGTCPRAHEPAHARGMPGEGIGRRIDQPPHR
jgi:hypothetical protein